MGDNDLSGKVFAITGGASGIGLATTELLLSRGASVAVGDIDDTALENAQKSLSPKERILFTNLDVSKQSAVEGWIKSIIEKFGKLSGAANCAGVIGKHHGTRKVEELEDDQWDLIMSVNLTGSLMRFYLWCEEELTGDVSLIGMMYCMRAQLQNMPGPGSIVCVSSVRLWAALVQWDEGLTKDSPDPRDAWLP